MSNLPPLPYASPAPPAPPVPATLTPEQMDQIQQTRQSFKKVRRATSMALVDGWTTAIFGALTTVLSMLSIPALLLGIGMVIIGYLQLRASARLKRLDHTALKAMAIHQVLLGILLFAYAAISLWQVKHGPSVITSSAVSDPQLVEMMAPFEDLVQQTLVALYLSLMAVALGGTWLMALYYRSRRKYIEAYRDQTPPWILDLQRAGMSI